MVAALFPRLWIGVRADNLGKGLSRVDFREDVDRFFLTGFERPLCRFGPSTVV